MPSKAELLAALVSELRCTLWCVLYLQAFIYGAKYRQLVVPLPPSPDEGC